MKRLISLSSVFLFVLLPVIASGGAKELEEISQLYRRGQFGEVVIRAGELLARPNLSTADSIAALTWLSKSAAQNKQEDLASQYLAVLVKMDPNVDFDTNKEPSLFSRAWFKFCNETQYVPGQRQKMLSVAVIEFDNGSIVDTDKYKTAGVGIGELIRFNLISSGAVYVPTRDHFNFLLDELKLSETAMIDPNAKLQVGRVIGAANFVFGTFIKMDKKKVQILARIVDTETTLPKKTFKVEGKDDKIGELTMKLADSILAYFNVEAEAIKKAGAKVPQVNLAALMAHSQGLVHYEEGNLELANKFFAQALEISPGFTLASDRQQRVEVDLKSLGQ